MAQPINLIGFESIYGWCDFCRRLVLLIEELPKMSELLTSIDRDQSRPTRNDRRSSIIDRLACLHLHSVKTIAPMTTFSFLALLIPIWLHSVYSIFIQMKMQRHYCLENCQQSLEFDGTNHFRKVRFLEQFLWQFGGFPYISMEFSKYSLDASKFNQKFHHRPKFCININF